MLEHRILAYRVKHCELQFIVLSTSPTNHTLSNMANPPYFAWEHKYHGVHNPWCYLWRLHRTYCWVLIPKCLAAQSRNFAKTKELSVDPRASIAITICFPLVVRVSIVLYWCSLHADIRISYQRSISKFVRVIIWVTDCSLIFAVPHINLTMYNDLLISSSC